MSYASDEPQDPPPPCARMAWPDAEPEARDLARPLALLERGALVALPTETVYGIAARADLAAAREALARWKGYGAARPWTWHVGSATALRHFRALAPLSARLAERYWPGPLTLVLHGSAPGMESCAHEGWTGLRFPAQRATARLLASAPFPVVMSSANLAGGAPAVDAEQVSALLRAPTSAPLALLCDGGRARLAEASSVLRLGPGHFELLREGLHSLEDLRRTAGLRIAFVCTGNTCRSPMAEGLARALLAARLGVTAQRIADFGFALCSRGIHAAAGARASEHAQAALRERGIDASEHVSTQADPRTLAHWDRIYCMTRSHREVLRGELARLAPRLEVELLDPEGEDVPDPFGGSLADYRHAASRIESLLQARLDAWA